MFHPKNSFIVLSLLKTDFRFKIDIQRRVFEEKEKSLKISSSLQSENYDTTGTKNLFRQIPHPKHKHFTNRLLTGFYKDIS